MSACFTAAAFSGVQSSSCPKFNNPDALILLLSFVCRLFLLLFLLFSFLATAHLLVKFAPIVLLEEIDVSPALKSLLKKAVRILQQRKFFRILNLLLFSKMNDTQFAKTQKRSFREYFFPFKSALSPSQRYTREKEERFYA
jgi:hypothetical protein